MQRGTQLALALALALLGTLVPASSTAQPRSVLVLPWSVGEGDAATLAARAASVSGALASGELAALSLDDARSRFEEHGSAEPPSVTDSEVDQWLSLSRLAVRHLAHADYAAARETLLQAQELSEHAAAELNREETRARQVLDTCLYDVRAYVETNDPRATSRAMECRRLVPRITPSPYNHTPEVVELLARVDAELAAAPPGSLHLDSDPSGCSVRLNGIELGTTPFVSADLATGEYRVQVECERGTRGRVHRIRLGEGTSTVRIDTSFDASVRSDTSLRLAYATQEDADVRRLPDAIAIANTVGAAEVWLMALDAGDVVKLDRVLVGSRTPLASVHANALSGLGAAVASLAAGRSEDRTGATVVAIDRWRGDAAALPVTAAAPPRSVGTRADWEIGVGIGLGVLAVAGFATSFALAFDDERAGLAVTVGPMHDDYLPASSRWQTQRQLVWGLGLSGGALGIAALALAMGEEPGTPWWSWVVGGTGLVGVAIGVGLAASVSDCGTGQVQRACILNAQQQDYGIATIGVALPLLSVPFVYLIREATGSSVTPSVAVDAQSALLNVGGTW